MRRNHPERLDPALIRAGRFDVKIQFNNAFPSQARDLFQHFFPLEDFLFANQESSTTPKRRSTTVNASFDEKSPDQADPVIESEGKKLLETGLKHEGDKASFGINSQLQLDDLAAQFVDGIFPSGQSDAVGGQTGLEVSMAALQGYLLKHKDNPFQAVEAAAEWATSQQVLDWSRDQRESLRSPLVSPPDRVAGTGGKIVLAKPKKKIKGMKAVEKEMKADEQVEQDETGENAQSGQALGSDDE